MPLPTAHHTHTTHTHTHTPHTHSYTQEQVYNMVADVDNYHSFLPWCQESVYQKSKSVATLAIGFPPLVERYTATVVAEPPHSLKVRAVTTCEVTNMQFLVHLPYSG